MQYLNPKLFRLCRKGNGKQLFLAGTVHAQRMHRKCSKTVLTFLDVGGRRRRSSSAPTAAGPPSRHRMRRALHKSTALLKPASANTLPSARVTPKIPPIRAGDTLSRKRHTPPQPVWNPKHTEVDPSVSAIHCFTTPEARCRSNRSKPYAKPAPEVRTVKRERRRRIGWKLNPENHPQGSIQIVQLMRTSHASCQYLDVDSNRRSGMHLPYPS